MLLTQGIWPFIIAAVAMVVGLLITWIFNIKRDASGAATYERIGNLIVILGFITGMQFRGYVYRNYGRTDTLPGPEVFALMMCLYIPLMVLATSYTQYRKDPGNEQLAQKLRSDSIIGLIALILFIVLAVFLKLYIKQVGL